MQPWPRRAAIAATLALVAGFAWSPILETDLTRGEFRTLAAAARAGEPRALFEIDGTGGHPLAAADVVRSHALWSRDGKWPRGSALVLRIESLAWLALAALALSRALRRLLAPWTGLAQARAAGWAAGMVLVLHPLHASSLASVGARGELIGLAAGAGALWAFLRGRQQGSVETTWLAGALVVTAALASDLALALPFVLAIAELFSARRGRPLHRRARTAGTTLVVFSACAAVDTLLRSAVLGHAALPALVAANGEAGLELRAATAFERLGTLLLPVDLATLGYGGFALAGALLLIAIERLLVAVRSAPRLWGWLAGTWLAALALAEACSLPLRVHPTDLARADTLAASTAVAAAGLGVCATALASRFRWAWLAAFALLPALLAHSSARTWRAAGEACSELRARIDAARSEEVGAPEMLVLEPRLAELGVDGLAGALPWMASETFANDGREGARVRLATSRAFCALAREVEFAELRRNGLAVLCSPAALGRAESEAWVSLALERDPPPSGAPRSWFQEGRSPALDLDPTSVGALRVRAGEGADTSAPPAAAWRADSAVEGLRAGTLTGAWSYLGDAPEAVFDLSSSPAWLLSDRARQIWSQAGWSRALSAELLDHLPAAEVDLAADGDDWRFKARQGGSIAVESGRDVWVLEFVDLESLGARELAVSLASPGELVARGARRTLRELSGDEVSARERVVWSLERRRDGVAIERARGRTAR